MGVTRRPRYVKLPESIHKFHYLRHILDLQGFMASNPIAPIYDVKSIFDGSISVSILLQPLTLTFYSRMPSARSAYYQ
jgi:hypothetical protein